MNLQNTQPPKHHHYLDVQPPKHRVQILLRVRIGTNFTFPGLRDVLRVAAIFPREIP